MATRNPPVIESDRDKLLTRPAEPLPTVEDPSAPHARGYPKDPKPVPPTGQGDPETTNPAPTDLGRSA